MTPQDQQRQELFQKLVNIRCEETALDNTWVHCPDCVNKLVDFILADRKRIVEPFINLKKSNLSSSEYIEKASRAITKVIKNAGCEL